MARKVGTRIVLDLFISRTSSVEDILEAVESTDSLTLEQRRKVVGPLLLQAVAHWETYVSDLFVARVNQDSAQLLTDLARRARESARSKFGDVYAGLANFPVQRELSKGEARALLDRNDWNLTFRTAKSLREAATRYISPARRLGFDSLTPADESILDLAVALRNLLAHGSPASQVGFREALAHPLLDERFRRAERTAANVGKYLFVCPGPECRAHLMLAELRRLASQIAVPL